MIEIIPAIDIIGGKCVRLTQGDFSRETVYSDDPLETAKRFEAAGLKRLHMVDLDGARSGSPSNLHVLAHVAGGTTLSIDYGGGIKSEADVASVYNAGASIVNIGSLAARQPEIFLGWVEKVGNEKLLLGADTRNGEIAIDGWQTDTKKPVLAYLKYFADRAVTRAFVTDIAFDGDMRGPSIDLYRRIMSHLPGMKLIASGGVRSIEDIDDLDRAGCSGVIVGKALYEKTIRLKDLAKYVG